MDTDKPTAVYHYDQVTHAYCGCGVAHIGPAGDVQLPAFSLTVAPMAAPAGQVARAIPSDTAEAASWSLVADHRTDVIYKTVDGNRYDIGSDIGNGTHWDGLGDVPSGLTLAARPDASYLWNGSQWSFDLQAARDAATVAIDAKRDEVLAGPFTYEGHQFAADLTSLQMLTSAVALAGIKQVTGQPYTVNWPTVDGTEVELNAAGVQALGEAAANRLPATLTLAKDLKEQIAQAADEAAIKAVVWPQQAG